MKDLSDILTIAQNKFGIVVLVGHSLGSLVAIDVVRNTSSYTNTSVYLVTMGSPVKRFVNRFFANGFFPKVYKFAKEFGKAKREDRWINVYRQWDYIGQSLKRSRNSNDLPKEYLIKGKPYFHSNYWGDSRVVRRVVQEILSHLNGSIRSESD